MENQIVEEINYIKNISKKKPSVHRLLAHINNTTAKHWDIESLKDTLHQISAKGIIDEHFKILSADITITPACDETTAPPGQPFTSMTTKPASTQTLTTTVSPVSSEQPIDVIVNDTKDEQINNL